MPHDQPERHDNVIVVVSDKPVVATLHGTILDRGCEDTLASRYGSLCRARS
jgi:hypothetical protein